MLKQVVLLGNLWIKTCFLFPKAYRKLLRPSSSLSAKVSDISPISFNLHQKLEVSGLEPLTSALQRQRSTN